jgi:uncharacterized membrane protein
MKEKLRDIKFWPTALGGVVILLQAFGLKIDAPLFNEGLTAIGGALILVGVLKKPTQEKTESLARETDKEREIDEKTMGIDDKEREICDKTGETGDKAVEIGDKAGKIKEITRE